MRYISQIYAALLAIAPLSFAQPAPRAHSANIAVQASPYLGVNVVDVDSNRARTLKLKEPRGAEITGTDDSGPAAKAGVKVGDVILEYNGQPVQDGVNLQRLVRETPPGREVKLSVWRNAGAQTLTATIENRRMAMIDGQPWFAVPTTAMPAMPPMPPMPVMPNLDLDIPRIQTILQNSSLGIAGEALGEEQQFAEFFGVKQGVLVKEVLAGSPAAHAGMKAGDVIVKVGDTRVGSLRELSLALHAVRTKGNFPMVVVRNKKETAINVVAPQPGG